MAGFLVLALFVAVPYSSYRMARRMWPDSAAMQIGLGVFSIVAMPIVPVLFVLWVLYVRKENSDSPWKPPIDLAE